MAIAVIPTRYGSTRFPAKALADRTGRTLTEHVWHRACAASRIERVIVATDDERIVRAVEAFGGTAVMTRADHPNGTSRIAEVAGRLDAAIVVNVQGDEPELDPALVDAAVETLEAAPDCVCATIGSPFAPDEDPANPNIVKVVRDVAGRALYFSRALVPHRRADVAEGAAPLKHVGLYAYRRDFLLRYPDLPVTPLERTEQLEQLRMLEHGHRIAVAVRTAHHCGIDTPEQYEAFVRRTTATAARE